MQIKVSLISIASMLAVGGVEADLCAVGSTNIDGNWFCQPVQAIRYSNVGRSGSYMEVFNMASDGSCKSAPKEFSGPLSPLDEEVSLHLRGPLQLKQLAVYTPSLPGKKKRRGIRAENSHHGLQHKHIHRSQKLGSLEKENNRRQMVTATIDGQIVSWENKWFGETATPTVPAIPQMITATIDGQVVSWINNWFGPSSFTANSTALAVAMPSKTTVTAPAATAAAVPPKVEDTNLDNALLGLTDDQVYAIQNLETSSAAAVDNADASATYERIGYYHSTSQTLENLVFLGNHGGQGSGIFDNIFGASLSYCDRHGTSGAAEPQILADTTIPSDTEVIVMLGKDCSDGDCGFVRPGAVAHHGFDGADKVFLLEFSMPMSGGNGFNADMPAIWMLNAQIPRTLQYGNAECSCWKSGCGEFDIAEALSPGSSYLKSTLHTNTPGGDSDYLVRPSLGAMKLAVIFDSSEASVHIQVLPGHTEFPAKLTESELKKFCSDTAASKVSHFHVS